MVVVGVKCMCSRKTKDTISKNFCKSPEYKHLPSAFGRDCEDLFKLAHPFVKATVKNKYPQLAKEIKKK